MFYLLSDISAIDPQITEPVEDAATPYPPSVTAPVNPNSPYPVAPGDKPMGAPYPPRPHPPEANGMAPYPQAPRPGVQNGMAYNPGQDNQPYPLNPLGKLSELQEYKTLSIT